MLLFPSTMQSESESRSVVSDSLRPHGPYSLWNSPGQNTGVGSHSLLQGIFQTQGSNPGLPCCRRILYQMNHQGNYNAISFLNASSLPKSREKEYTILVMLVQISFITSHEFYIYLFIFNFLFCFGVQMISNVLVSDVQQSNSVIHIHASIHFQILFPFMLLYNIEHAFYI